MSTSHLLGRLEDKRLLTGQGRYAADWNFPGQAHAAFLRSDRAHAEIVSIDAAPALALPGVLAVLTADDVKAAGFGSLPVNTPGTGRGGQEMKKAPKLVLAQGRVRFVGECVACVIAESAMIAQDAVERISIEYRDLPVVVDPRDALKEGAPQLHAEVPGNLIFDFEVGDEARTEAVMRSAPRVVRLSLYNTRVSCNPMEPRACLAAYDASSGMHTIYCPSQGVGNQRV